MIKQIRGDTRRTSHLYAYTLALRAKTSKTRRNVRVLVEKGEQVISYFEEKMSSNLFSRRGLSHRPAIMHSAGVCQQCVRFFNAETDEDLSPPSLSFEGCSDTFP